MLFRSTFEHDDAHALAACLDEHLSIGLVFTLIIALDYPFRGELSVDDDAYLGVKEVSNRAFESAETIPAGGEHGSPQEDKK